MNDDRGSLWRRWDLHVHTPASFVHDYGANDEATWQRFIADLEALPPEIKVIGINDYLFLEGYERVRRERQEGRLSNIDLLLPVVELRLDKFGGTTGNLSRVNFHVIFSDQLSTQQIQEQFLNLLVHEYTIGPESTWRAAPSRESLEDLGKRIIAAVPQHERSRYGHPLKEGFSNLNYPLTMILDALDNSFLRGNYFTAVGKTEWWDVKWNDQSIAEKRNVIESADFVFIAAEGPEHCQRAREALRNSGVNHRLLDCSDAHCYSDSEHNNRLGHTYTWIKSDPTFDGLRQVRMASDDRVYLGLRPSKMQLVAERPTRFLRKIEIRRKETAVLAEQWFDNAIPLNHDLVAVIGNKGMGKSALADAIALTGNSDADPEAYGFLRASRFRSPRDNKARNFVATSTWESGGAMARGLEETVPAGLLPMVRYIPQNFFETLCNETADAELLQRELRKVIFSNLQEGQRGSHGSLEALIDAQTTESTRRIDELRGELRSVNREIVALERELSSTARRELEDALQQREAALAAHMAREPKTVDTPTSPGATPELDAARTQRDETEIALQNERSSLRSLRDRLGRIDILVARFTNLADTIESVRTSTEPELEELGLTFDQVCPVAMNLTPLADARSTASAEILVAEERIGGDSGLVGRIEDLSASIAALQETLDAPTRQYQQYLEAWFTWEHQRAEIVGSVEEPGSIENLKAKLTTGRNAQAERLSALEAKRLELTTGIHHQQTEITTFLGTLYEGVMTRMAAYPAVRAQVNINFAARLEDIGLTDLFTRMINRTRIGGFSAENAMRDLLVEFDLESTSDLKRFLGEVWGRLHRDVHDETGDVNELQRQLRNDADPEKIYNLLFGLEYLAPRYALQVNGRDVEQLTPGERGSLLLVFYLLIDQDERPLIIDQPEENLDNQSVYELLVPCINDAKSRRQIIVVTHNPNLAVVCNAEQVIFCRIDKEGDHAVTYESGGLENPRINRHVVDVLEGTWPAFADRGGKYERSEADV